MATLAELVVKIGADTKQFTKGLSEAQKQAETTASKFQNIGSSLSSVGTGLTAGLTVPLVAAGGAAFKLASDMNESLNKVNVAFKTSSKEVQDWSDTTLKSYGIAKGTSLDMAATFGDMATSMGLNTKQASAMSMNMVGLAGDLASFKNISIDVANTALNGVFTGETESLKQLGIVMTQANLQEFAYAQGIKKRIQDMTQAEQVQLRYNYILANTKNAQGDFDRTSAGAANQMRMFSESVKELGATIGQNLVPVITPVITKINEMVQGFGQLSPTAQQTILVVAGIAAVLGPLLIVAGGIASGIGSIISVLGAFGGAAGLASAAAGGLGAAFTLMTGPVGITIAAIAALVAGIVYMWNTNEEFRTAVQAIWADIQQIFSTASEATKGIWAEHGTAIKALAGGAWNEIKLIIETVLNAIVNLIGLFINLITGDWEGAWINIKAISQAQLDLIKGTFNISFDALNKLTDGKIGAMVYTAEQGFTNFKNTVLRIWNDITSGIKKFVNQIINGINTITEGIGTVSSYVPGMAAVNISPIPQLAAGGIVTRPTVAMIGEAGPEAVIPLNRANGAGGGNNFYFNITGANARDIWDELQPKIERSLALAGV